jgi:phenylpropionate dioxygenase-like ring-hydroxylating dioxygenase large terminal subunit
MKICYLLFPFMVLKTTDSFIPLFNRVFSKPTENINSEKPSENPFEIFDRSWYVVGEKNEFKRNTPYKITVWDKDYVLWKTDKNTYSVLEDVCPHKGAAFSVGSVNNGDIVCPYHGYEFNSTGKLTTIPGICFQPSPIYNVKRFIAVEKHGWIYLNTLEVPDFVTPTGVKILGNRIFIEPEATDPEMKAVLLHQSFMTYPRIVSENSLDIMHIAFVHTFGNKDKPAPSVEDPPKQISPDHWRSSYVYESGRDSMVSKLFKIKRIDIDNEFALPHITIARIKFGDGFVNTVVTAACPISERETKLFVKTYRNFFREPIFDGWFRGLMKDTLNQDKAVIESIKNENMDGKFNMKFDKLQNTYKTLYKKHIRS